LQNQGFPKAAWAAEDDVALVLDPRNKDRLVGEESLVTHRLLKGGVGRQEISKIFQSFELLFLCLGFRHDTTWEKIEVRIRTNKKKK